MKITIKSGVVTIKTREKIPKKGRSTKAYIIFLHRIIMALKEYNLKRDFKKTTEPKGKTKSKEKNIFVVQRHNATRLHYDLRLEINGVLKSWAIPKKPSSKKGVRNLAVETEDHPLEYANFEGTIPKGQYGAGKVTIWDRGTFRNMRKISMKESFQTGLLEVYLSGENLKGGFALINTKFQGNKRNWLLIKMKDDKYDFPNG